MRKFYTLIRRELWEHKTGFIIFPFICTITLSLLLSLGFLRFAPPLTAKSPATTPQTTTPALNTPGTTQSQTSVDLNQQFSAFHDLPLNELPPFSHIDALKSAVGFLEFSQWVLAAALNILLLIAALNYAHRTLFDDRKNREILFWRSMPVAETENLAAKLSIIYGLVPLMILAMSFLGGFVCWLAVIAHGANDAFLAITKLLDSFMIYLKSLLFLFALLPIFAWTLLASAYAKKSPFLLSTFLPIGLLFIDRLIQWATGINTHIRAGVSAYTEYLSHTLQTINSGITPSLLVTSLPFIIISGVFMAGAVWLRNHRYEI